MKQCPNCGVQADDNSRFCKECGNQFQLNLVCPRCGTSLTGRETFCENCGCNLATVNATQHNSNQPAEPVTVSPFKNQIPYQTSSSQNFQPNYQQHIGTPQPEKSGGGSIRRTLLIVVASLLALGLLSGAGWMVYTGKIGGDYFAKNEMAQTDTHEVIQSDTEPNSAINKGVDESIDETSDLEVTEPKLLKVIKAEYQKSLKPQAGNTYYASNMIDGNPSTAWAVNLDGDIYDCDALYGPCFTFAVRCKKLAYIVVRNGYGKNNAAYKNNARAKYIRVGTILDEYGEDEFFTAILDGKLADVSTPQTIYAHDNEYNKNFCGVQVVFDTPENGGIFPGAKWNDLCISEIEFWGYE